jgi:hypothetical protein
MKFKCTCGSIKVITEERLIKHSYPRTKVLSYDDLFNGGVWKTSHSTSYVAKCELCGKEWGPEASPGWLIEPMLRDGVLVDI